jgi:glycerophosphoryl diester phosphodiesterase
LTGRDTASPTRLPRVIGHRGAAGLAPENTLTAIARAAALGCSWVEFDVKLTADNEVVVFHDDRLERTTDGVGLMAETVLAAVKRLDAGSWFAPEFRGEPVPTLAEAVALIERLGLAANVEIKPCPGREIATAIRVAAALRRLWPRGRPLLLSSFKPAVLEAARATAPELPRGLLVFEPPENWAVSARRLGCVSLNVYHQDLTAKTVAEAKAMGLAVATYTVNDPARALELVRWGVDTVISDRPDVIGAALAEAPPARQSASAGVADARVADGRSAAYIGHAGADDRTRDPAGRP